jgi:uncharacterized protein
MAEPWPRSKVLALALGFEGGLLALALVLGYLVGYAPWDNFTWSDNDAGLGVAGTLPLLSLYFLAMRWPVGSLRRLQQILDELVQPLFGNCTWVDLAAVSFLAGLGEECLFRGVMQAALDAWLGVWPGLFLASLLFGLAHCLTLTYALLAALVGMYLGWLWHMTGNLLTVVVTHALYDFVVLVHISRRV